MNTQHLLTDLKSYFSKNRKQILDDYFTFLSFPSISSEKEHAQDVRACADWLNTQLESIGFETEIWETSSHPVIFATHLKAGNDKPTLLIYNHYDVQPIDPIELWESPPFEPTIKDEHVFARGAQDNKGQCFYVFQALKAILEIKNELPLNIKLCIEGEEEFASTGLSQIIPKKTEELSADYLAVVDVGIQDNGNPAITLGVRGLCTMDLKVCASNTDLHSGSHGGIAINPIHVLIEMLASSRNANGEITIPGFYDDVDSLSEEEKNRICFDFDSNEYHAQFKTPPNGGEKNFTPLERAWIRPTIEVNGIEGGYTGSGFKTVIPAIAKAKISCRLVPHQDPKKIAELVAGYLKQKAPNGVKITIDIHKGSGSAVRSDPKSKAVVAFAKAYKEVFLSPCSYILQGGSIPIVTKLAAASQADLVLLGLGLPSDQIHAPNENFGLDRFEKGFLIMALSLHYLV